MLLLGPFFYLMSSIYIALRYKQTISTATASLVENVLVPDLPPLNNHHRGYKQNSNIEEGPLRYDSRGCFESLTSNGGSCGYICGDEIAYIGG